MAVWVLNKFALESAHSNTHTKIAVTQKNAKRTHEKFRRRCSSLIPT